MRAHEDDFVCLVSKFLHQPEHAYLGVEIKEGSGLVEQDDGCLLGECFGEHGFLPLAVAQGVDGSLGETADSHHFDGFADNLPVFFRELPEEACIGRTPHPYEIGNLHVRHSNSLCQHDGDGFAPLR